MKSVAPIPDAREGSDCGADPGRLVGFGKWCGIKELFQFWGLWARKAWAGSQETWVLLLATC